MTNSWMPEYTPPWEEAGAVPVREAYAAGLWSYAVGRPAAQHPRYREATDRAEAFNWSPWWIRTYADVEAVLQECWFDERAGRRVVAFLQQLTMTRGEWRGEPFALMDWQAYDLVMPLYGWMTPEGLRRYTKGSVWIPKKNGKSCLASGLGLYHLRGDKEGAPYVWIAAGDRAQAGIIHDESTRMVKATPGLLDDLRCVDSRKRIVYPERDGVFEALSADAELKEGLDWSAGIFDELHVGARKMWTTLSGGGAARRQPIMLSISTAGVYDVTGIGWEQWDYGQKVADGSLVDSSFFSLTYGATDEDDWEDWHVIERANPSLGVTCKERYLQERLTEAQASPRKIPEFERYHLNRWTAASTRWIDQGEWIACAADAPYERDLIGRPCWGGMDLSLCDDITAFVLWFKPSKAGEKHRVLPYFWLPKDNAIELEKRSRAPYTVWSRGGHLMLTDGNWIDHRVIRDHILDLAKRYKIQSIGYDPYRAVEIVRDLQDGGLNMVEHRQGMLSMSGPTSAVEGFIRRREMAHPDHPVLNWMVSNCMPVSDRAGNTMLMKGDGKVRHKIDGVVAMLMAQSVAGATIEKISVYESRGLLRI